MVIYPVFYFIFLLIFLRDFIHKKIKNFKIKSKFFFIIIIYLFIFEGLYSQKIKTLKNFKIKSKENKISHGRGNSLIYPVESFFKPLLVAWSLFFPLNIEI